MYLLPKFLKCLCSWSLVVSNCGTHTEKGFEFLEYNLQLITGTGMSYIQDTNYFFPKFKNFSEVRNNTIIVTGDAVEFFARIPDNEGLNIVKKQFDIFIKF